jgi:hypothetical protein
MPVSSVMTRAKDLRPPQRPVQATGHHLLPGSCRIGVTNSRFREALGRAQVTRLRSPRSFARLGAVMAGEFGGCHRCPWCAARLAGVGRAGWLLAGLAEADAGDGDLGEQVGAAVPDLRSCRRRV